MSDSVTAENGASKVALDEPARARRPAGTAATADAAARSRLRPSIADRVGDLRARSDEDPDGARRVAWDWIERLRADAMRDGDAARETLDRLFAEGQVPAPIDGSTDGLMISTYFSPFWNAFYRRCEALWIPWLGKHFNADAGRGENRVTDGFRFFTRLFWLGYAPRRAQGESRGFAFFTRVERGGVEPAVPVLVIDYRAPGNPRRVVARIRDELVQIVPGVYLGRALWRTGDGTFVNVGHFALRDDQSRRERAATTNGVG